MDTIDEHKDEPMTEPVVNVKKEKKLSQLAAARESAKTKKRQRDDDLSMMKDTLNNLTALLSTKKEKKDSKEESDEEEDEKPKKKAKRVTKEPEEVETEPSKDDTWGTSAVRTGALVALAGASYYFSNIYGNTTPNATSKKKSRTTASY